MIRFALVAALAFSGVVPSSAFAQNYTTIAAPSTRDDVPAQPCVDGQVETLVRLRTALGPVDIALATKAAPATSANFLKYVDQKRFTGATFYRVVKFPGGDAATGGLVQGGQRIAGKALPPVKHEPTSETGLKHVRGAVAMARGAPGSATSDFFIDLTAVPAFDADPSAPGDNLGYAVFGRVVSGIDTAERIFAMPIDAAKGPMTGQMLAAPVTISAATRVPRDAVPYCPVLQAPREARSPR